MIVESFPLMLFIKLRSLTNGNFKKTVNAVNKTNIPFLPLKLTATWFFFTVETKWLEKNGTCTALVTVRLNWI